MATHRCITDCFHHNHLYQVGDPATFQRGEKVPEHFEPIKGADKPDAKKAEGDKDSADKPDAAE